jgi:hypothetical protein
MARPEKKREADIGKLLFDSWIDPLTVNNFHGAVDFVGVTDDSFAAETSQPPAVVWDARLAKRG